MDLLKEITEEFSSDEVPLMEAISQAIRQLHLQKKGQVISNKEIKKFMSKNNELTMAAAMDALAAYQQYKTNKRNIISLFAKSPYEKRLIRTVVDAMLKTGKYKLHRQRYAEGGGRYYEIKQIKAGF